MNLTRILKSIVIAAIVLNCSNSDAATPLDTYHKRQTVTVDYLLESCSVVGQTGGSMITYFDCESYIYGVLDAYLTARSALKADDKACFPAKIAPWQVYEEMMNEIPESAGNKPAAREIIKVLRKKYPCK